MAALVNGWEDAGFAVELQPIAKDYFAEVVPAGRTDQTDVFWANWAPAWPSASTVIPPCSTAGSTCPRAAPVATSAVSPTTRSTGRSPGSGPCTTSAARPTAWGALDASLAERGIFVALAHRKALYVAGSSVTGLVANQALGGFVDLATVGVK